MLSASVSRRAGGIFEVERRISQELARLPDVTVGVFGLEDQFTKADLPQWQPLEPRVLAPAGPQSFGYCRSLLSEVTGWNPDLLHLHSLWMYPSVVMNRWRLQSARPTVITANGMLDAWALRNSRWKKRVALALFERENLEKARCIQALNENEAASIRAFGLTNPVAVIPNAVDLPEEPTRRPPPPSWSQGRKVLLFLGRIHPKKGLVPLLKAWSRSQAAGAGETWVLAIAGWDQGDHERELQALADELNLPWLDARESTTNSNSASVVFLGPQFGAQKDDVYRIADAFILPSFSEGLPMAVLEAWAYRKPVVMTPMCNLPEGFAAGAALSVETEVASIASGLITLMAFTEDERGSMGDRGGRLVVERFLWPQVAARMHEVYRWLLGAGPRPACVLT